MSHPRPRTGSLDCHVPVTFLLSCLFILTFSFTSVSAWSAQPAITSGGDGDNILQFTSAGHVLGFEHDSFYVAGVDRVLRVYHVGGRPIRPVAKGPEISFDGVPDLGAVEYFGAWDGVDVVYKASANGIFESFYHVSNTEHGLPVNRIRLRYNRPVGLDEKGSLVTAFENGNMVESAPVAWQEVDGEKRFVDASFVLYGKDEVGFALGDCLPGIPVVIDPVLTRNTFLGDAGNDRGFGITADGSGNVYVTGNSAASWGSPRRGYQGGIDAFVAKLNGAIGDGFLFMEGNGFLGGDGDDSGHGIALDDSGNIYVVGYSSVSWVSPARPHAGNYDAFALKLNGTTAALEMHVFLGGSGDRSRGRPLYFYI